MSCLKKCTAFHCNALKLGTVSNIHHATRVLNAYTDSGLIADALLLFDEFTAQWTPDSVCWNSMVSACVHNGRDEQAFAYFKRMHCCDHGCRPDSFTLSSLLSSAYCLKTDASVGQQLHGYAFKTAILSNLSVGNALITLYAKWGRVVQESRLIFESMFRRNVISWTAIISGHSQQRGHEEESLKLFVAMTREQDQRPNHFTLASVFSSCAKLTSSSQGIPFITLSLKMGLLSNILVQNSLLGFYAECGWMKEAKATFHMIRNPDLVSWNSLLKGYSQQGMGEEALNIFQEMLDFQNPDTVTFVSILSACRHRGMVVQGLQLFTSMKVDHGIEPQSEHISCIVDLLGRAGQFRQAEEFIKGMQSEPTASVWRTLLGVCCDHGQATELAELAASKLLQLDPYDSEAHVVLSHVYAASGQWDMVKKLRRLLKDKGVGKEPGFSWIELGNRIHSFVAADWGHPMINDIQTTLVELTNNIKRHIADLQKY